MEKDKKTKEELKAQVGELTTYINYFMGLVDSNEPILIILKALDKGKQRQDVVGVVSTTMAQRDSFKTQGSRLIHEAI